MAFWTYIMANQRNGTIYVGHTENLYLRDTEHRTGEIEGFTRKYGCKRLVWLEEHPTRQAAFARERAIKEWRRVWKLRLIEEANPTWRDLYDEMFQVGVPVERWTPPDEPGL